MHPHRGVSALGRRLRRALPSPARSSHLQGRKQASRTPMLPAPGSGACSLQPWERQMSSRLRHVVMAAETPRDLIPDPPPDYGLCPLPPARRILPGSVSHQPPHTQTFPGTHHERNPYSVERRSPSGPHWFPKRIPTIPVHEPCHEDTQSAWSTSSPAHNQPDAPLSAGGASHAGPVLLSL